MGQIVYKHFTPGRNISEEMLEIVEKLEMLEIIDCWAGVQLKSCDALSTAEESEIQFNGGREQKYKIQKNTFLFTTWL